MKFFHERIASLLYGFTLPYVAFRLILSHRRLLFWSLFPVLLTLVLSIWGVALLKAKLVAIGTHWLVGLGLAPNSITARMAVFVFQIVLFLLTAISFSFLAGLVASPFNDFLAEATEPLATPPLEKARLDLWPKVRAFSADLIKTVMVTGLQLGLLLVGIFSIWLPGLNVVPFAAAFWLLAFQFLSYPQSRRGEPFALSIRFLFSHPFSTFGFGSSIGLLFSVPILSSFALPLAVVGGTLLYARAREPGLG